MTATDELRRLLDERGVEWMDDSYAQLWCTVWHGRDGKQWRMTENRSGMLTELKAWQATPEQAIEATLGGALQAENERLQDENGRLRSCLSDSAENAKQIMHEAHMQEEENIELRELVRDMWHEGAFAPGACYVETDRLEDRTRELGIEVDDA